MTEAQIPDLNLFMMCRDVNASAFSELPEGFFFDLCRRDELELWKAMHFDEPDEAAMEYMTGYFERVYKTDETEFFRRCLFVRNAAGEPVATCFLWRAWGRITTLHWLKVKKGYEGRGIGRALLTRVLGVGRKDSLPVFLHTQPSSFRAIKLYTDFGFSLLTDGHVGARENNLGECLPILKEFMPEQAFAALRFASAPELLLEAAGASETNEF